MIKNVYENAIAQIEANKNRECEVAKQKAMQEKVIPYNAEVDASLRDAIAALQNQHNTKIMELQQAFDAEKKAMVEAATKRKNDFAESTMASVTSIIEHDANKAIAHLRQFIDKQGA